MRKETGASQDGHLLVEYRSSTGALKEFVWLGETLIAVLTNSTTTEPRVYYAYSDHLNTPRVIVNSAGDVRLRWIAEPFGNTAAETIPDSLENLVVNLRFPGQYFDKESWLSYNYFRDYDATTGRYVQSDPIGLGGGSNVYSYSEGSPINYYDQYGLFGMDDVWARVDWMTNGWVPSQAQEDFGSGFGDLVTFGISAQIRGAFDIGSVNRCSTAYGMGKTAGVVTSIAIGGLAGSRSFARHISPNGGSNFSHSLTARRWSKASDWSRSGNRMNGDYLPTTGTRPDLHDLMDATAAGIGMNAAQRAAFVPWPAWRRAINRIPYTPGALIFAASSAALNDADCSCAN